MICPHSETCSVCSWISLPLGTQKERKLEAFRQAFLDKKLPAQIDFVLPAEAGIRDRIDLTYENGSFGFYQKNSREIFSLDQCPVMSEPLFAFYQQIQKINLPIKKGSLRLRVSPQKEKGLWLDFANEDIRDLLAEKTALNAFLDLASVEIGQRRKKLTREMKLKDPEFHPWTRTWVQERPIDLFSTVASFSQAGDVVNRALIQEIEKIFTQTSSPQWVEFGAGSGNLTFSLAGQNRSVKALEFDSLALEGLKRTLEINPDFQTRIQPLLGDFQRKSRYDFRSSEGVLVNPPRSGLQKFLDPLLEMPREQRPRELIYMSCYLESYRMDSEKLFELGYEMQKVTLVDQFPHSPHFEILSLWKL